MIPVGKRNRQWRVIGTALGFLCLWAGLQVGVSRADEEYVLGPEDVISITVWEHPELSRTVAVRATGEITVPPLGGVPAAGKTTTVLARDLERQFYNVLRQTTQVTISVIAFNSKKVYLAGQVGAPGRYSFERIPDLVDLLGQAGGLGPTADLTAIRIMRRKGATEQSFTVDVTRAMEAGEQAGLPELQAGDVVFVPTSAGVPGGTAAGLAGGNAVYVLGSVGRPGAIPAGNKIDLFQALSMAGGLTPDADLHRVEILAQDGRGGPYLVRVDLEKEILAGRGGPSLRPGDSIRVPSQTRGLGHQAWGAARTALGVSRDVLNLFLIRNVLK